MGACEAARVVVCVAPVKGRIVEGQLDAVLSV
jgi:hypothetical protein